MTKVQIQRKLNSVVSRIELYEKAEKEILEGAQSYRIGSRDLTRADLGKIQDELTKLYDNQDELENMLSGAKARKCVGVVPRDW